jgi:hypothetical protein
MRQRARGALHLGQRRGVSRGVVLIAAWRAVICVIDRAVTGE